MNKTLVATPLLSILALGCFYGYDVTWHTTRINSLPSAPTTHPIGIMFEDSEPNLEYIQLAYIEVTGYEDAKVDTLLSVLKKQAEILGADAVIFIKRHQTDRGRGVPLSTFIDKSYEDRYTAPTLTGVAIKYK